MTPVELSDDQAASSFQNDNSNAFFSTSNPTFGTLIFVLLLTVVCVRRLYGLYRWGRGRGDASWIARLLPQSGDTADSASSEKHIESLVTQSNNSITQVNSQLSRFSVASILFGVDVGHNEFAGNELVNRYARIEDVSSATALQPYEANRRRKQINDVDVELAPLKIDSYLPQLFNDDVPVILKQYWLKHLLPALPSTMHLRDLRLLYNSMRDGYALSSFYRRSGEHSGACLMLIQDLSGCIFGCYTSHEWRISNLFYGNNSCFVFTLFPTFNLWTASHDDDDDSYFMLAKSDYIALGGGDNFAIWLSENFRNGLSLPCKQFNSPVLSHESQFTAAVVELWGFV